MKEKKLSRKPDLRIKLISNCLELTRVIIQNSSLVLFLLTPANSSRMGQNLNLAVRIIHLIDSIVPFEFIMLFIAMCLFCTSDYLIYLNFTFFDVQNKSK